MSASFGRETFQWARSDCTRRLEAPALERAALPPAETESARPESYSVSTSTAAGVILPATCNRASAPRSFAAMLEPARLPVPLTSR